MIPPIWLCARRCMNQKKATKMRDGDQERQQADEEARARRLVDDLDALGAEHIEVGVGDAAVERAGGAELASVGELAGDRAVRVVDLDALDLPVAHLVHEVGVGDLVGVAGAAQQRPEQQDRQREAQEGPQAPARQPRRGQPSTRATLVARRRGRRRGEALGAHGDRIRGGRAEPQPATRNEGRGIRTARADPRLSSPP